MKLKRAIFTLTATLHLAYPWISHAQEIALPQEAAPTEPQEVVADGGPPTVVFIVPRQERGEMEPLLRSMKAQLGDLDVVFKEREMSQLPLDLRDQFYLAVGVAGEFEAVAVLWQDFRIVRRFTILVPGYKGHRLLVRRIEDADAENPTEAMAIIARASVTELLHGGLVGEDADEAIEAEAANNPQVPPPVKPEPPDPQPPASPPEIRRLALSASYGLQLFSTEALVLQGADFAAEVRILRNLAVGLGYMATAPLSVENKTAGAKIRRHPTSLFVRYWKSFSRLRIGGRIGLGLDYLKYTISDTVAGVEPVQDRDDILWSFLAGGDLAIEITNYFGIITAIILEIPLNRFLYSTETEAGVARVLAEPWPIQPRVTAGLYFEFL